MKSHNSQIRNILVIGGAGYVGSKLVMRLLQEGHFVTVYDLLIYGNTLESENGARLKILKGDVRDALSVERALVGIDTIYHFACISNDPSFELDPKLGKEINFDSFEPLVLLAKKANVRRFIFASSSSVYGVSNALNVTEEHALSPLTDYSYYKMKCEQILLKYNDNNFVVTILRPATVCGFSPRQRLDVILNILTTHAYFNKVIIINGGDQLRPNIHIDDLVDAYVLILEAAYEKVSGQIFNVGDANMTVKELGSLVQREVKEEIAIQYQTTIDPRSYHIASHKIQSTLGFNAKRGLSNGIKQLIKAFDENMLPCALTEKKYYNIKTMLALGLK
jgi:nucleoside-diphosphate-sugar epimerase